MQYNTNEIYFGFTDQAGLHNTKKRWETLG